MTTTTLPPGSHLDEAVRALAQRAPSWAAKEARELAALVRETRATTATVAAEWAETAALAKGLTLGTQPVSEEWQSGPWALLRHLRILESSLDTLAVGRKPRLPGTIRRNHMGRVVVPTYPIDRWDRILFPGIRAETWMQPGVAIDDVTRRQASAFDASAAAPGVALVLGAGNITSIGPMDALHKLFTDRVPAILKMSPVLDHLTHIMCHALRPLIEADGLRIVTGGSEAGSALTHDPRITQVHITGSDTTYEHVMFGTGEDG
ncbi:MAG: aldehyde dehydrogenase, partial [Acidimicrobiia bacterium]|nr:aldehyde dehydrogenase [Acidimicrobiia bacterium]